MIVREEKLSIDEGFEAVKESRIRGLSQLENRPVIRDLSAYKRILFLIA
jgi:hypothetical protein